MHARRAPAQRPSPPRAPRLPLAGFAVGVVGAVFSGATALLFWFWVPWEAPPVTVKAMPGGFTTLASDGGSKAAASAAAYEPIAVPESGSGSGGGYQ